MKAFQSIKYWIFDLDNTLYSAETKVFDQVEKRMTEYVSNKLNTNMFIGEQLQISRDAFVNLFRASLEKDDQEQPEVKEAEVVEA